MKTKEEKLALLESTAKHFNLLNRGVLDSGTCKYNGVGCAIGRLIEDKELCEKLDNHINGAGVCAVFDLLPEEVQAYGGRFLCRLQFLHDDVDCWTTTGLSEFGKSIYEGMKTHIQTNVI